MIDDPAEDLEGKVCQCRAAEAARLGCHRVILDTGAPDSGIGGDDAVETSLDDHVDRRFELARFKIGGELDEHGHPATELVFEVRLAIRQAAEQAAEKLPLLETPQARRIGRGDVHREVIDERRERPHQASIVVDCVLELGRLLFADVGAEDQAVRAFSLKPPCDPVGALAGETHAVDERPFLGQAEYSWSGVPVLRFRCDSADLDVTEPQRAEPTPPLPILVIAGCETDPIVEPKSEYLHRLAVRYAKRRRRGQL